MEIIDAATAISAFTSWEVLIFTTYWQPWPTYRCARRACLNSDAEFVYISISEFFHDTNAQAPSRLFFQKHELKCDFFICAHRSWASRPSGVTKSTPNFGKSTTVLENAFTHYLMAAQSDTRGWGWIIFHLVWNNTTARKQPFPRCESSADTAGIRASAAKWKTTCGQQTHRQ